MVFPTDGFYIGAGDLEHEIEFMVGNVVFDVAVLNNADEPGDLGVGTEFFGDLADEGCFHLLTRLDVPAG